MIYWQSFEGIIEERGESYQRKVNMYEKLTTESRQLNRDHSTKILRKKGYVPGIIYGKGLESLPIMVPGSKLHKFLESSGRVFEVQVSKGQTFLVNLDNIQWDHMGNQALHVAFHKLEAGVKTRVTIPIHFVGESKGHKLEGGVIHQAYSEIEVEGLPKDMPEYIEIDISDLDVNSAIHLSEINPPQGCSWYGVDPEIVLISCQPPRAERVEEEIAPEDTPVVGEEAVEAADSDEGDSEIKESAS